VERHIEIGEVVIRVVVGVERTVDRLVVGYVADGDVADVDIGRVVGLRLVVADVGLVVRVVVVRVVHRLVVGNVVDVGVHVGRVVVMRVDRVVVIGIVDRLVIGDIIDIGVEVGRVVVVRIVH